MKSKNPEITYKKLPTEELLQMISNDNDNRACGALMQRFKPGLYHYLFSKINDHDLAEDITLQAFARAFMKIRLYRPDFAFTTWLYKIAFNILIDFLRSEKSTKPNTIPIDKILEDDKGNTKAFQLKSAVLSPEEMLIHKQQFLNLYRTINKKQQYDKKYSW